MDRKAWIIITICLIGMGVNWHFATKNAEQAKRIAEEKAAAAAAQQAENPEAAPTVEETADAPTPDTAETATTAPAPPPEQIVTLERGTVSYEFSTLGGGIRTATLAEHDGVVINKYPRSSNRHEPVGALRREPASLDTLNYEISEQTQDSISFTATTPDQVEVTKTYRFSEGEEADDHLVDLTLTLTNNGTHPYQTQELYLYTGTMASLRPGEFIKPGFFWNNEGDADYEDSNHLAGGWFSDPKPEYRASFSGLRYGGVMSRFFTTIVSRESAEDQAGNLWASRFRIDHSQDEFKDHKDSAEDYALEGAISLAAIDLAPGASRTDEYSLYLGPKEYHRLKATGGQRSFVMFYGWFTPISKLLTNTMNWLYGMAGNWGVAIILMTLIIRIVIWPLQAKSQYQMKRMGLLGPKMKELQEKYKDEPQKQQAEMMKLYRDYGVNPLGGCLPMFLQIPIFFGFYRVLQFAAELRGQEFLWVKDLSLPDTVAQVAGFDINPLPLLMGISMVLQMKVAPQPATVDKMQQRIFMLMPLIFLVFCYNFAAALALYWTTQNIFSIFQTWAMKLYMPEPKLEKVERKPRPKAPANNPFMPQNQKPKDKKNRPPRLGG